MWIFLILLSLYLWHVEKEQRRKVEHFIQLLDKLERDINEFLRRL